MRLQTFLSAWLPRTGGAGTDGAGGAGGGGGVKGTVENRKVKGQYGFITIYT